jgi:hypothetical protein
MPTLGRFEKAMGRAKAIALHLVLIENFIASYSTPPIELTLDLDGADDAVHGRQEGCFSHGLSDRSCLSCRELARH